MRISFASLRALKISVLEFPLKMCADNSPNSRETVFSLLRVITRDVRATKVVGFENLG